MAHRHPRRTPPGAAPARPATVLAPAHPAPAHPAPAHPAPARSNRLHAALRQGQALLAAGRAAEAERLLRGLLQSTPRAADLHLLLGLALQQRGQWEDAGRHLGESAALDPGNPVAPFQLGCVRLEQGRPAAALAQFDRVLALRPDDPAVLSRRAAALFGLGRTSEALADHDRVIAANPRDAAALVDRGVVLFHLDRLDLAVASYDRAIALAPDLFEAWYNKGNALLRLQRPAEALAAFDRALACAPGSVPAWLNHGNALRDLGRGSEALASYARALALQPDCAEALYNRGNVLLERRAFADALASYEHALAMRPSYPEAAYNRGVALLALQQPAAAAASFQHAIALRPDDPAAHYNLAGALQALGRQVEAVAAYDAALARRPAYAEALNNRANLLLTLGHADAALAGYHQAIAARPDYAAAFSNRANLWRERRDYDAALADFERAFALDPTLPQLRGARLALRMQVCEWSGFAAESAALLAAIDQGQPAAAPFPLLALPSSAQQQRRCAERYSAEKVPAGLEPLWRGELYRHAPIRLGYLSADFQQHAVAFLAAGLFEQHDRSRFALTAFSLGPDDGSATRRRLVAAFDRFIDLHGKDDLDVARHIRAQEIDILIDLKGLTGDPRPGIAARRPAPVQVNFLGYPGTLGAPFVDYIIGDRFVTPVGSDSACSEQVVRLPDCYQPNDRLRPIATAAPTRADAGLPPDGFVFCCFNNSFKITPDLFDVWMRLLRATPGSVLWLLGDNARAAENLRREAATRGVDPARLVFAARVPLPDHLARHRLADLFLDTFHYGAHTTASDALWAGLPVVSCLGETFASRVGASLLAAAGLPELITHSAETYAGLAQGLANDPGLLARCRAKLAANRDRCALFDTARFARHLEAACLRMWERQQRGEPPAGFDVPRIE